MDAPKDIRIVSGTRTAKPRDEQWLLLEAMRRHPSNWRRNERRTDGR